MVAFYDRNCVEMMAGLTSLEQEVDLWYDHYMEAAKENSKLKDDNYHLALDNVQLREENQALRGMQ